MSNRPCITWRTPGGFWRVHEDGNGGRLRISNTVRQVELGELSDVDLQQLQQLIAAAISTRAQSMPGEEGV